MMIACCMAPLALVFAAVYFFGLSKSYLYWTILLLCPITHYFMMKNMHKEHEDKKGKVRVSQIDRYVISKTNLDRDFLFTKFTHKELWVCKVCQDRFDFKQKKLKNWGNKGGIIIGGLNLGLLGLFGFDLVNYISNSL